MIKVCNLCGTSFPGTGSHPDSCPDCLSSGRGDIRDYHYASTGPVPAEPGESVEDTGGVKIPETPDVDDPETPGEPLEAMSRTRLSALASERGLPASGTRADILARLQAHAQG